MSVEEHLYLYARIKGIDPSGIQNAVNEKVKQLDLESYRTKLAGNLSGGNKRKLCVAIATIGNPKIVFLDEPSTGAPSLIRCKC